MRTLVADPVTRDEGIRRLRYAWLLRVFSRYALLTLADALAARGDYTDAAVWYAVFLDMFEGADPDLESMLTAVRERLMTLVEEHP